MITEIEHALTTLPLIDGAEADHVANLRDLLALGTDFTSRFHYNPGHVTASAFVVHPDQLAVLLIHHAKLGAWLQPGGHIEASDPSHEAAARREVEEETGLGGLNLIGVHDFDIHTFPRNGDHPEHLHYDLRWAYRANDAAISVGDGVKAVRWVPFAEALTMRESVARPVRKLAVSLAPRS